MSRRQVFEGSIALACSSIINSSPSLAVMGMQPGLQDKNKGRLWVKGGRLALKRHA